MSASATATAPQTLQTYARDDAAGQLRGLEEDGYAIIPSVITPAEVAELRRRIDELTPFGFDSAGKPGQIDHFKCVFNRSPFWLQYLDKHGVIDGAEAAMGADCHIIGMTAWRTPPGAGGFGMHLDQLFFPVEEELLVSGRVKTPVMLATAHYYLDDLTIDLCPTWIVPGTHKSGRQPSNQPEGGEREWRGNVAQPVLVKAGDVMIFRSEVWHSGSKNATTDRTRYLLQVHYGRRMMAQKFSPYLDFRFNLDVVSRANPRQQRLMGKHSPSAYD